MNILIICDYYPPDTAIAAVRPYMMAKYLSLRGHNVVVIRSGELSQMPDNSLPKLDKVKVISLFGDDSDAERFERGEKILSYATKTRLLGVPSCLRDSIIKIYRFIVAPWHIYRLKKECKQRVGEFNEILNTKMENATIDVVFSTCGGISIIAEGSKAANFYKCKWIADFRDVMFQPLSNGWLLNRFLRKIQDDTVKKADAITAVSDGIARQLSFDGKRKNVFTLYNGYEHKKDYGNCNVKTQIGKLVFCYTGRIYSARLKAFKSFAYVLKMLIDDGSLDTNNIEFIYAGPDSVLVKKELQSLSIDSILVDRGYVTRTEVMDIQDKSDIFLVLSWNTRYEKGVLTGKFYEGIRAHKVILSVVTGGEPDSELFELNEKYRYGFCYEDCKKREQLDDFKKFILEAYNIKMISKELFSPGNNDLIEDFRYDNLACKLEEICKCLIT